MFCPGHATPGLGSYHYNHNIPQSVLGQDQVLFLILPDSLSVPSLHLLAIFSLLSLYLLWTETVFLPTSLPHPMPLLIGYLRKTEFSPHSEGELTGATPAVPQISGFSNSLISGCFTLRNYWGPHKAQSQQTNKSIVLYLQTSLLIRLKREQQDSQI